MADYAALAGPLDRDPITRATDRAIRDANAQELARMEADPEGYQAEVEATVANWGHITRSWARGMCPTCGNPLTEHVRGGKLVHPADYHSTKPFGIEWDLEKLEAEIARSVEALPVMGGL